MLRMCTQCVCVYIYIYIPIVPAEADRESEGQEAWELGGRAGRAGGPVRERVGGPVREKWAEGEFPPYFPKGL